MSRISVSALLFCALALSGCNNGLVGIPPTEAEFEPLAFSVPFPSDVFLVGQMDNTPFLLPDDPTDFGDPKAAFAALDGFSNTSPYTVDFTNRIDPSTIIGGVTVRVFEVSIAPPSLTGGAAVPNSLTRELSPGLEYDATLSNTANYQIVIKPRAPWPSSEGQGLGTGILIMVTNGIEDRYGRPVISTDTYKMAKKGLFHPTENATSNGMLGAMASTIAAHMGLLGAAGVDTSTVVVSASVTIQSVRDVLDTAVARAIADSPVPTSVPIRIGDITQATGGLVTSDHHVYQFTIDLPTYSPGGVGDLSNPPASTEPWSDAISQFWTVPGSNPTDPISVNRYSPTAQLQSTQTVPVIMVVPTAPLSGTWGPYRPLIFCHGITRQRSDVLALANLLASAGFTIFSMDLPLHGFNFEDDDSDGVADNPFYAGPGSLLPFAATERTFEIDLQTVIGTDPFGQLILEPGPDGLSEPSGTYFLNFGSLLTTRSNIWQAVSDLTILAETIPSIDVSSLDTDGDFVPDSTLEPFPSDEVHYIGQSLGGIVGTVFAGSYIEDKLHAVTMSAPSGGLGKMLEASPAYHSRLTTFFASQDAFHGTTTFEQGVTLAQTLVDAADPASHAERAGFYHPIYMQELVGGAAVEAPVDADMDGIIDNPIDINLDGVRDVTWYPDWVVSNNSLNTNPAYAAAAPVVEPGLLGGTSALGRLMGLTPMAAGLQVAGENETLDVIVKHTAGEHGSLLSPGTTTQGGLTAAAMQLAAYNFHFTDGEQILISGEVADLSFSVDVAFSGLNFGTITAAVSGDGVSATFATPTSMGEAAAQIGADHFNWYQVVIDDNATPNDINGDPLVPTYVDPPAGGYGESSPGAADGIWGDIAPWYWHEAQVPIPLAPIYDQNPAAQDGRLLQQNTNQPAPGPGAVGDPDQQTELYFSSTPAVSNGHSVTCKVWLVSVNADGSLHGFHNGFTWNQVTSTGGVTTVRKPTELNHGPRGDEAP